MTESRKPAPRRRPVRLAAALALATALAACAGGSTGPLLLHPVPPTLDAYSLEQGATIYSGPDFRVAARPWDYRLVAEECDRSGEACPFGEDEAEVGRFIFIRLLLENRSTHTLVFNPMRTSLLREGEAPLIPLEYSDLFAFADDEDTELDSRGRAFRRVSFDGAVTIRPGQAIERYLVFPSPLESTRQVVLEIDDLWLDAKAFDLHFAFESYPEE